MDICTIIYNYIYLYEKFFTGCLLKKKKFFSNYLSSKSENMKKSILIFLINENFCLLIVYLKINIWNNI